MGTTAEPRSCGIILGVLVALIAAAHPSPSVGASQSLVISQLQVAGAKADDEFIELYNTTNQETTLDGWSLQYKSAGSTKILKKNFITGSSIPAHGYFLTAQTDAVIATTPDMRHSSFSMASDGGTVALVSSTTLLTDFTASSIVDKLAYGTGTSSEGQGAPAPTAGQALERKPGGTDGNGTDTDNNAQDFFVIAAHPRGRLSPSAPTTTPSTPPPTDTAPPASTPPTTTPSTQPSTTSTATASTTSTSATSTTSSTAAQSSATAAATPPAIVLNEVVSDPADGAHEWVELYWGGSSPVALDGATIEDAKGTIATLSGSIGGETSFVIATIATSRLNNSGDAVILKWRDGSVLDRMTYGDENDGNLADNAPAPPKNASLIRTPDGAKTGVDLNDWRVTTAVTPGAANQFVAPAPPTTQSGTSDSATSKEEPLAGLGSVRINEFVPDPPDNGFEWVELINTTKDPLSLAGWNVEEGSGEKTPLSGVIGTNEFDRYVVVMNPKGALNNPGDRILVRDPSGRIIDDVAYGSWANTPSVNAPTAPDPFSIARIPENYTGRASKDFVITTTPTLGSGNRISAPPSTVDRVLGPPPTVSAAAPAPTPARNPTPPPVAPAPNLPPSVMLDAPDEATIGESVIFDARESTDPEGKPLVFGWELEGQRSKTGNDATFSTTFKTAGKYYLRLTVSDGKNTTRLRHRVTILPEALTEPSADESDTGASNQAPSSTRSKKTKKSSSTMTTVDDIVSAPFGIVGSRRFALASTGVVSLQHGNPPTLEIGSHVRVHGKRQPEGATTALSVALPNDIARIGAGESPPATSIDLADLDDTNLGKLIHLQGEVETSHGSVVTLSAAGEQITLALPPKSKLSKTLFVEGDSITATGILSKTTGGYRLFPRIPEDVEWLARAPAAPATGSTAQATAPGLAAAVVTASLASILYALWRFLPKARMAPPSALLGDGTLNDRPRPLHIEPVEPELLSPPPDRPNPLQQ